MHELLSGDDIHFFNMLVKNDIVPDKVQYNIRSLGRDEVAKGIIGFMLVFLAPYCFFQFKIKYNKELYDKFLTRTTYNDILTNFFISCESAKLVGLDDFKSLFKRDHLPKFSKNVFNILRNVIYNNRSKIASSRITPDGFKIFELLYKIYMTPVDKIIDWSNFKKLVIPAIVDSLLRKILYSIETTNNGFDLARNTCESITASFFDTMHPSKSDVISLCATDPNRFHTWRTAVLAVNKVGKNLLLKEWKSRKLDSIIPVAQAKCLCKSINLACPIDDGFSGKVGISSSATSIFSFYTKNGLPVVGAPGIEVEMNPDYRKNKDSHYCTGYIQSNIFSSRLKFYTKDCLVKISPLHARMLEVASTIEGLRDTIYREINTNSNALAIALSDSLALPISDTKGIGVNSIKVTDVKEKFLNIKGSLIECKDKQLINALNTQISNKNSGYLFKGENGFLSVRELSKYVRNIGFSSSLDSLRRYRANVILSSNLDQGFFDALEITATSLFITPNTCLRSYIDPVFIKNYFDLGIEKPSKAIRSIIKSLNELE